MEGDKIKTNILIAGKSGWQKQSAELHIWRRSFTDGCGKARDG